MDNHRRELKKPALNRSNATISNNLINVVDDVGEEMEEEYDETGSRLMDLFEELVLFWLEKNGHDAFADALLKKKVNQLNGSTNNNNQKKRKV